MGSGAVGAGSNWEGGGIDLFERAGGASAGEGGLLRAVFDVVAAGLYVVDVDGVVRLVNPGAQALLGMRDTEMVGRRAHDLFHAIDATGRHRPVESCPLFRSAAAGVPASTDSDVFVRADGSLLPVAWSAAPISDDEGNLGSVVIFYDITVRIAEDLRHDVELAEARRASDAAAAQAARTAFLAETTAALISTLDVDEALARLARILVPRFASWCVIDLLEEGDEVRRVAVAHHEPARVQRLGTLAPVRFGLPPGPGPALARVLRGAPSVIIDAFTTVEADATEMERRQADLFGQLGGQRSLIVGLRARQSVIGAVTLVREDHADFDEDERALAEDIALRAGIAIDNARLFTDTRSTAEALQRSLLPSLPTGDNLSMCAAYFPAAHGAGVGGDWYDAFRLPGRTMAVILGDVVGHDLQAAAVMGDVRNLLRAASLNSEDPAAVLSDLDRAMSQFLPGATATVVYARLEPAGSGLRLRWSNAGHPPPLLILPDGSSRYLETEPDPLLGVGPGLPRSSHAEDLPPGALVLLYSDGLVEDRAGGIEPGMARMRRSAARLAAGGPKTVCDHLVEEVASQAGDDIAIIAVGAVAGD